MATLDELINRMYDMVQDAKGIPLAGEKCILERDQMLDLLAALSYLMQGRRDNFRAVFRAWRDFIRWHGALARKRREIRANRKGSAAENIYRGSVVLRYLFGRRTFGGMMR